MTTRDNGAIPTPEWQPEPRCCPFADCGVCETDQQAIWRHLPDSIEPNIILGDE